jgi:hypothetical protein
MSVEGPSAYPSEQSHDSVPTQSKKRGFPLWAKIGIPAIVIVLAGAAALLILSLQPSKFEAAVDSCGLENDGDARLGDKGNSLTLNMEGEDDISGLSYDETFCVIDALEAPDSVTALMGETRALDGRQTAEWDGIQASWSYHPDNGLDLILSR